MLTTRSNSLARELGVRSENERERERERFFRTTWKLVVTIESNAASAFNLFLFGQSEIHSIIHRSTILQTAQKQTFCETSLNQFFHDKEKSTLARSKQREAMFVSFRLSVCCLAGVACAAMRCLCLLCVALPV